MGIVAKQSIQNTIYTYIGFLFGGLNTLFLFTSILDKTDYGTITYLMTAGNLLWPFLAIGLQNTIIKFYPSFTTSKQQQVFFSWILLVPVATAALLYILYFFSKKYLLSPSFIESTLLFDHLGIVAVMGVATAYFELFYAWSKVHLKSVSGNFLAALFIRICISFLLMLVYFEWINVAQFIVALAACYIVRTVMMGILAHQTQPFQFHLQALDNTKKIISYSCVILLASTIATYMLDLDKVMIEYFRPIEELPSYTIAIYIASVIAVPARALMQITSPLTASFMEKKDYSALKKLNKTSSLNGLIIAGSIAVLILSNTASFFALVPNNYTLYGEIVLCIAIAKVFDASLGVTNSILLNSEKYKWVLFFGIVILCLAITLNILLIPQYGIIGAAVATMLSYGIFNIIKLLFVRYYFKMQPFEAKTIFTFLFLSFTGLLFYFWNPDILPLFSIGLKGTFCSIVLISFVYFSKFSMELSGVIKNIFTLK